MSGHGKRKSDWIDLTSDGENSVPQPKHMRQTSQPAAHIPSQSWPSRETWSAGDFNEEADIIELSQDVDEGLEWTIMGVIDDKVVGVRHYDGYATPGEQVMIKREPSNPHDSNAIRINNVQGTQIGHIPRNLAAKLAPYMVCCPFLPETGIALGSVISAPMNILLVVSSF